MVGGLQRRRAERLRAATAEGQPVAAGGAEIGWSKRVRWRESLRRPSFRRLSADPKRLAHPLFGESAGGAAPSAIPSRRAPTRFPSSLNYEPDLFGRVRRNLEASNANLQATAADMYNVNLVLTSELAADYFSLRELDAETQVVQESVEIQQKGLQLVRVPPRRRSRLGTRPGATADVARLDRHAALPGAAAARAIRARDRGADRQSGLDLQRPGAAA